MIIFGAYDNENDYFIFTAGCLGQTEQEITMECGCGRSPTGKCIGWHKLSEEEYQEKLKEDKDKEKEKDQKFWKLHIGCKTLFLNKIRQQVKIRGKLNLLSQKVYQGIKQTFDFN